MKKEKERSEEQKHTPGPWGVDTNGNVIAPTLFEDGPHPLVVAEVYEPLDARLIAAGPRMLEALRHVQEAFETGGVLQEHIVEDAISEATEE